MILSRLNVTVAGDSCDVHARTDAPIDDYDAGVAFCGVYVRPVGPVPGYWYFPVGLEAAQLLTTLGVRS